MLHITEKEEKKVEYLELIYDLIFVYIIGRNNSLLHHAENGFVQSGMFLAYLLCTLAVIQIWNFSAYYINLYGRNGLREHIFLFTNMFLLYFVAEGTRAGWEDYHAQYHIAWGLILLNIALQYLIELRRHPDEPHHRIAILRIMCILAAEAVLVFANIPLYRHTGRDLSIVPIALGIGLTFLPQKGSRQDIVDFAHLSERAMLYVVFTFGEMVIAIASYFEGELTLNRMYFSLMAFLIVVGLFLSYGTFYDRIIDREQPNDGLWYMFIHVFLIFALNNITNSLEFMQDSEIRLMPKLCFLIVSFLIYYSFLFMTGRYARTSCRPTARFYAAMAAAALSFVLLMLLFRNSMQINIALTVIYVYAVYGVIYRFGQANRASA